MTFKKKITYRCMMGSMFRDFFYVIYIKKKKKKKNILATHYSVQNFDLLYYCGPYSVVGNNFFRTQNVMQILTPICLCVNKNVCNSVIWAKRQAYDKSQQKS